MGCIPHGFGASTNAQGLHPAPSSDSGFQPTYQILTGKCDGNSLMMNPYLHPQHMKVVKHMLYVWSGCGKHSTWVWSLNQCTRAESSAKQ